MAAIGSFAHYRKTVRPKDRSERLAPPKRLGSFKGGLLEFRARGDTRH
jgi:hypothetical protein